MSGVPDPVPPASPVNPPASPAAPPTPAPAPAVPVNLTSEQLAQRLAESKNSGMSALLRELGFEKADDAKSAIAKLKKLETDSLSEKEKLEKRIKELEPQVAAGTTTAELLKAVVEEQFAALPAHVQAAIDADAKGDSAKRFAAMKLIKAASAPDPNAPPVVPPKPAPTTVATPPAPPPSGGATKFQEWQQMNGRSPVLGDIFYQNNKTEIERTRPSV